MAEEPRRSGRATKGQHKHASPSPPPAPKQKKTAAKSKSTTKKQKAAEAQQEPGDEEGGEDHIRCICGNDDPDDGRAFISCDSCEAWQHNVCMGLPEDEDDVPEHYFCEQCVPDEHAETVLELKKGEKVWERRNGIYQQEKKQRGRKKKGPPGWLKQDVKAEEGADVQQADEDKEDAEAPPTKGNKRKREVKEEDAEAEAEADGPKQEPEERLEERSTRSGRQDKRRKSSAPEVEPETVSAPAKPTTIAELPNDRQKIATFLKNTVSDAAAELIKGGLKLREGQTAANIGEKYGFDIEDALFQEYGGTASAEYASQFRALHANMKRNLVITERIIGGSLTVSELATMATQDMASAELQKERAAMKEQLDRQAIAVEVEGPRFRRTHKGDELIEDENQHLQNQPSSNAQPVRERMSVAEDAAPTAAAVSSPKPAEVRPQSSGTNDSDVRRASAQNFDMNNIWAKANAHSPPAQGARPAVARRSVSQVAPPRDQTEGAQADADVDRLLRDDDDDANLLDGDTVWRGKLVQGSDGTEPLVNARFVAGRDLQPAIMWRDLLPPRLTIDGRLQQKKAEEYLCSLQWSASSDVSVLALTPYDDASAFNAIFKYFQSRERYAVVNNDKPSMIRDLYIIPVEPGKDLPEHLRILEHCTLKQPIEQKILLATFVVVRAPGTPPVHAPQVNTAPNQVYSGGHLPSHLSYNNGPSGSPLTTQTPVFSPPNNGHYGLIPSYNGGPPAASNAGLAGVATDAAQSSYTPSPLVMEVLGPYAYSLTVRTVVTAADNEVEREKLEHLRKIFDATPAAAHDFQLFAAEVMKGRDEDSRAVS